jgi:hypothetical protein
MHRGTGHRPDGETRGVTSLQDPEGVDRVNSSVLETKDHRYIGSLVAAVIGRLPKAKAALP